MLYAVYKTVRRFVTVDELDVRGCGGWAGPPCPRRPWLNLLFAFVPFAIIAHAQHWSDGVRFTFALLSIAPFAERLGFVTEQLAMHTNETRACELKRVSSVSHIHCPHCCSHPFHCWGCFPSRRPELPSFVQCSVLCALGAVGGLLNATFGNATELIVAVFALRGGLLRVVQVWIRLSCLSAVPRPFPTDPDSGNELRHEETVY